MASTKQHHCICLALLFILIACASQAMSRTLQDSTYERHEQWMARYGRVYKDRVILQYPCGYRTLIIDINGLIMVYL
jgi:outer membrane biogenesis lipoprotein LolB